MGRKQKTYEEVTGALARCGTSEYKSCDQCPYSNNTATCVERMTKDALDLINRQHAEIEELQKEKKKAELEETDSEGMFTTGTKIIEAFMPSDKSGIKLDIEQNNER